MTHEAREMRLALFYAQRSEVQRRKEAEAATYHSTGAVFSSAALKTLLSFNVASIIGYPIFLSQLPSRITAKSGVYETLEMSFWAFVISLSLALLSTFIVYINWEIHAANTHHVRRIEIVNLNGLGAGLLEFDEGAAAEQRSASKKADKANRRWLDVTHWSGIAAGLFSFISMIFGIYNAGELFQRLAAGSGG